MKVEFQLPGMEDEHEVEFVPRKGDRVCNGAAMYEVLGVTYHINSGRITIALIPEIHNRF